MKVAMLHSKKWLTWGIGPVALAGAVLGNWMFGLLGLMLFTVTGLSFAVVFRLVATRASRLAASGALLLAGAALQSASTLGWGAADAADGTRYKASPVGLSHVLTPHQPVSETIDCGWYAASGYPTPCNVAAGGQMAFFQLRTVYPLVMVAAICCLVGAMMSLPTVWRLQSYQALIAGSVAVATLLAVVLFATSFGSALEALNGLSVGTGGTLGTMQVTAAMLLCLTTSAIRVGMSPLPLQDKSKKGVPTFRGG